MYLDHFGLKEFPFRLPPDPALLFWTAGHRRAFDLLNRAARDDLPVTTILGEPGTGKSTLLQHFVSNLPKDTRVGMISNYSSGLGGLGHWLHWAFDLRPEGPESRLRGAFEAYLVDQHHESIRCLLIVDEAQNVSDEDITTLSGLTRLPAVSGRSMRLVLAGQPRLRSRFPVAHERRDSDDPALLQIGALSPEDVAGYIRHRMAMSGCPDPVFDDEATARIARLSAGVPRLINVLCELLLTSAFGAGKCKIDSAFVDRVLQDVRQTGMLDHLLTRSGPSSGAARPMPISATSPTPPADPASTDGGALPPPAQDTEPIALCAPVETESRPTPAHTPALANAPQDNAETRIESGGPRNRRAGLAFIAAGAAAAAMAVAILPARLMTPAPTVAALQQDDASRAQATVASAATPVRIGPVLPVPAALQGSDAVALHNKALIVGRQDPLAAAIGFARAAVRGDTRAAFYLGQHFEAGDGVPRNAALAAAWYASASESQRSARRAMENLTETTEATGQTPTAAPRPLTGIVGVDGLAEFIWAAPDGAAARYLIELAEAPDAPLQQYGPFDLSATLLYPAVPLRLWRVVSLGPEGARIGASEWHLIDTDSAPAIGVAR